MDKYIIKNDALRSILNQIKDIESVVLEDNTENIKVLVEKNSELEESLRKSNRNVKLNLEQIEILEDELIEEIAKVSYLTKQTKDLKEELIEKTNKVHFLNNEIIILKSQLNKNVLDESEIAKVELNKALLRNTELEEEINNVNKLLENVLSEKYSKIEPSVDLKKRLSIELKNLYSEVNSNINMLNSDRTKALYLEDSFNTMFGILRNCGINL